MSFSPRLQSSLSIRLYLDTTQNGLVCVESVKVKEDYLLFCFGAKISPNWTDNCCSCFSNLDRNSDAAKTES